MITGFEKETEELSDYERKFIVPNILDIMIPRYGKSSAITNKEMIRLINTRGHRTSGPRIRKVMHILRVNGTLKGVVATSKGYYLANTDEEWRNYLRGINERIAHIQNLRNAVTKQYNEWQDKQRANLFQHDTIQGY